MSVNQNPDVFYLSSQKVKQLNSFLSSKNERVKFIPFSTYIHKKYHPHKNKTDIFPDLYSTYVKLFSIYNKIVSYPKISQFLRPSSKHPNLLVLEKRLRRFRYSSLYEFGKDLRQIWNYYFRYYSGCPKEYQNIYYMSEFCEEAFKEMENSKINYYNEDFMLGIKEKEKLVNDITKLNTYNLKGIITILKGYINEEDKQSEGKTYEFDIEKLSKQKLEKLKRFVEERLEIQRMEELAKKQKEELNEEEAELMRITQLRKDLGYK